MRIPTDHPSGWSDREESPLSAQLGLSSSPQSRKGTEKGKNHARHDTGRNQTLEELRASIQAENISYGELALLESLSDYIESGDVELAQWAGIDEEEFSKR